MAKKPKKPRDESAEVAQRLGQLFPPRPEAMPEAAKFFEAAEPSASTAISWRASAERLTIPSRWNSTTALWE